MLSSFVEDLSYGVRTLRRAPGYTLLCALTLGVGIGAATAIFSIADPIIIRPLPYGEPDRTYVVWENDRSGGRSNLGFLTYADVRDRASVFESTAALGGWSPILKPAGRENAQQLNGLRVSWSYFRAEDARVQLATSPREMEERIFGCGRSGPVRQLNQIRRPKPRIIAYASEYRDRDE